MDIRGYRSVQAEFNDSVWITCEFSDPSEAQRFLRSHVSIRYLDSERTAAREMTMERLSPGGQFLSVKSLIVEDTDHDWCRRLVLEPRRMLPKYPVDLHLILIDADGCRSLIRVYPDPNLADKKALAEEIMRDAKKKKEQANKKSRPIS